VSSIFLNNLPVVSRRLMAVYTKIARMIYLFERRCCDQLFI
jgi:hypothetical protein